MGIEDNSALEEEIRRQIEEQQRLERQIEDALRRATADNPEPNGASRDATEVDARNSEGDSKKLDERNGDVLIDARKIDERNSVLQSAVEWQVNDRRSQLENDADLLDKAKEGRVLYTEVQVPDHTVGPEIRNPSDATVSPELAVMGAVVLGERVINGVAGAVKSGLEKIENLANAAGGKAIELVETSQDKILEFRVEREKLKEMEKEAREWAKKETEAERAKIEGDDYDAKGSVFEKYLKDYEEGKFQYKMKELEQKAAKEESPQHAEQQQTVEIEKEREKEDSRKIKLADEEIKGREEIMREWAEEQTRLARERDR